MSKRIDKKLWGVLGKQQTYYSPQQFLEGKTKVPLNASPFESWDAKRSKYNRVDGVPNHIQQHGVVPQDTTPVVSPTPSSTPQPTPTNTPTNTPTQTTTNTPTPSATPTYTPTQTNTPTPSSTPPNQSQWNGNTTNWNNETDNWENA